MSTRPQFSRILHFVGMLAMSVTGTATIAQEARPPLQTKQQGPCTLSGHGFTVAARQRSFRQVPPRCRHYGHVSASLNGDAIRSSANGDQSAGRQASRG